MTRFPDNRDGRFLNGDEYPSPPALGRTDWGRQIKDVVIRTSEPDLSAQETVPARASNPKTEASSPTRRGGRKSSPEKRLRILEAAIRLFTTRDYHQVVMEHIAEQAGVGKGTVYRYFPTKEDLFLELVHIAVDRASEVIREGITTNDPAIIRLRRCVAMTLEYFRKNEAFYSILYHDKVFRYCKEREDLDLKRAELHGFFVQLLAEGIAEGSIRSDMEPAFCASILMASMRASLRIFGSKRTSEQLSEQVLKIILEGVADAEAVEQIEASRSDTGIKNAATHSPTLDPDTMARLDPLASLSEDDRSTGEGSRDDVRRPSRKSPRTPTSARKNGRRGRG